MAELGIIGILFALLIAILWILMPFAIFGTKDKLQTLIDETKKTNDILQKLNLK